MLDVIVIGGSYAGISAAIQLGRARRSVLVIDAGQRRNRFATTSHGFLGHDGASPGAIAAKGKSEALAYPSVTWREAAVTEARATAAGGAFLVRAGDNEEHQAKRLILATGVVDELPEIPGVREQWGKNIFHCPYCHGYELNKGKLGVLATSPLAVHHASLVAEWGAAEQTTLFLNGALEPDAEQLADLASRGIRIEHEPVTDVHGAREGIGIELRLRDGRTSQLAGLFLQPKTHVPKALADQLGCELEDGPTGSYFKTDATKETTVPGVFACGDVAIPAGAVALAVADGVMAGFSTHKSLVFRR